MSIYIKAKKIDPKNKNFIKKRMLRIQTGENNLLLRKVCKGVEKFDENLEKTVEQMTQTMLHPDEKTGVRGIGIAANQCGIDARILILIPNFDPRKNFKKLKSLAMINPEILEISDQTVKMEEGCLSLPGVFGKVSRPAKVRVRWQNIHGEWGEKKLEKWPARIFLHELDHLNGVLFTDHLKPKPEN